MDFRSDGPSRMKLALLELRAVAIKKFQRADRNTVVTVANEMLLAMWEDPRFIKAFMIEYANWTVMLNRQMEQFCTEVYRDMKNAPVQGAAGVRRDIESQCTHGASVAIPASAGEGDGVRINYESQKIISPAPSSENEDEAIHTNPQSQVTIGPSSSFPDRNGGVQKSSDSQSRHGASIPSPVRSGEVRAAIESHQSHGPSAATPNRNDVVQSMRDSQTSAGRVVPIVNKPAIGLSEMQRMRAFVKPSAFETCSIRGVALVHMTRGDLKKVELKSVYDAALTRAILDHCVAPDSTRVPDLLKETDLAMYMESAKKEAEEVAKSHAA